MIRSEALNETQLAGQRLMVGFEGKTLDESLTRMIADLCVGGLALFKRNISDPEQLALLCHDAQGLARECGNPPLLIAIDQEGGPVARLGPPFTVFPGNPAIGQTRSATAAQEFGTITARELKGVGINVNFAPVLDIVPADGNDLVMADRVFGSSPETAGALGIEVIQALQSNGVAATAKHFPGIGRTTTDSHADLPRLDTRQADLESKDLVPFRRAVRHHVAAVMLAHVVYETIDPDWPASLSVRIGRDLLRRRIGFTGVSITDDLDMGAIAKHYDMATTVERVCAAGIDVALICRNIGNARIAHDHLMGMVHGDDDAFRQHLISVDRILALKARYVGDPSDGSGQHPPPEDIGSMANKKDK